MSAFTEKFTQLGCDTAGALHRLLDSEDFLKSCVKKVLEDPGYEAMLHAVEQNNAKEAFEQAHMLKGITGNVGLTPLYDAARMIVEPLRAGSTTGLVPVCQGFIAQRDKLLEALSPLLDQ